MTLEYETRNQLFDTLRDDYCTLTADEIVDNPLDVEVICDLSGNVLGVEITLAS